MLVRAGGAAPGFGAGATFNTNFSFPTLNRHGVVAFAGSAGGGDVTNASNSSGIWAGTPGNLRLVMRGDDPAPFRRTGR